MPEASYSLTMGRLKRAVTIFFFVGLLLAIASMTVLVLFNFMGVFTLHTGNTGSKYEEAFTYPGWQALYYGVGTMIIQGYTEWTTDIWLCAAFLVPFFAVLVLEIMVAIRFKRKGTNRFKAVAEFIMAGLLLIGGIMLFNCDKFTIAQAKQVTDSYTNYYKEYLLPALEGQDGGYFRKEAFPTILLIVCLLTALVKGIDGALLLIQKSIAEKHRTQNQGVTK